MNGLTMEAVHGWLNQFRASALGPSARALIDELKAALDDSHMDAAARLLGNLEGLATRDLEERELVEIWVECALAKNRMEDGRGAAAILEQAVSRAWSDSHRRAVICWLYGCVLVQEASARPKAVGAWQASLADFEKLADNRTLPVERRQWYRRAADRQTAALQDLLAVTEAGSAGATGAAGQEEGPIPVGDLLGLFPVVEEIPAGTPGAVAADPQPIGSLEVDRVLIDGRPHRIVVTVGGHTLTLPHGSAHTVVRIRGDSMNRARPEGIDSGDFVLLRNQERARDGEMVAAEIDREDSCATLKYYHERKGRYILRPASSNPEHQEREFPKFGQGFRIRGVVVAVFKPL